MIRTYVYLRYCNTVQHAEVEAESREEADKKMENDEWSSEGKDEIIDSWVEFKEEESPQPVGDPHRFDRTEEKEEA